MKKILPALLVVAVLVTVGITLGMMNSAQANGANNTLVVDTVQTSLTLTGGVCDLEAGQGFYSQADVYEEGQYGTTTPIGISHVTVVKTEPPGICGVLVHRAFRIFGQGDIYTSGYLEPGLVPGEAGSIMEAITGGNGDFVGAAGETAAPIVISNSPRVVRREFRFHRVTPVGGVTSFLTPGSDSSALGIALLVSGIAVSVALFAASSRYASKRRQG